MPLYNFRFTRLRGLTEPVEPVDPGTGGGTGGGGSGPGDSGTGNAPGMTAGEHEAKGALAHNVATTESHGFMSKDTVVEINNIAIAVDGLTETVNDHNAALNSLSDRVDSAESAISGLTSLTTTVSTLNGTVTDHVGRIEALENQNTAQALTNTSVDGVLTAYSVRFDAIEDSLTDIGTWANGVDTSLNNLSTAVGNQNTAHDTLATTVSILSNAQSTLSQTVTNQGTAIGDHESRLDTLEAATPGAGSGHALKTVTNSNAAVYSFVKTDADKYYRVTAAVEASWTVQNQAAVSWVDGEELQLRNLGPETLTLVGDASVTLVPAADGTLVLGAGMAAVLRRVGENLWDVFGQTEPAEPFDPDSKVDVVVGKGLSTNDFTDLEKDKLAGLAQADWDATVGQPGHILNKPAGLGGMTMAEMRYDWMDFSASAAPWTGAAISSGTVTNAFSAAMVTADPDFYGVILIRCTTAANTGYRITNSNTQMMASPGMHFTTRFMIPIAGMTTAWAIMGLHDSTAYADPVDGVYLKLSGASCNFVASQNSVRTTGAAIPIVNLKWYVLHIDVISSTEVRFSLTNDTDNTVVFAETLTTNIPAANAARALGAGVVAVGSHLATADVLALDWIGVGPARHTAFGTII